MRRSIGLLALVLAAAVAATGCHGHAASVRQAAGGRPDSSATTPSAPATGGVVVGVIRKSGALEFYRVGRDRRALHLATFEAPAAGLHPGAVSLASGPQPLACATWVRPSDVEFPAAGSMLRCYRLDGAPRPATVDGLQGNPIDVALSADGRHLAWIDYIARSNETDIVFGALAGNHITSPRRITPGPGMLCNPCLGEVNDIAWAGDDALVLSRQGQDDEGFGLGRLPLDDAHIARGWSDGPTTMTAWKQDPDYRYFDYVVSAGEKSALAVERITDNGPPPSGVRDRAVSVDFATSRRSGIVATALPGRNVTAVSGGPGGIVYVTDGAAGMRVYLRLPGDPAGQPITGLPRDATAVVAQPS